MKARLPLYLVIVVAMLVSLIAVPVLAEGDDILMWVSHVRLAYNGRSSHSSDRVVAMVHVRDADQAAVVGAEVKAEWRQLPHYEDEDVPLSVTAETNEQGIAEFEIWDGFGTYEICVTDVTRDGWLWDEIEVCGVIELQWPYNPGKD